MIENEFSGAQSVVTREPDAGDYEPRLWIMRSLAAIGIIVGTAGLMFMPFGLIRVHEGSITGDLRVHFFDLPIQSVTVDAIWLVVSSFCGVGLALVLLAGSLGALRLRRWARPTLILWAIGSFCLFLAGAWFSLHWLLSSQRAQFSEVRGVVDTLVNFLGWGIGFALAVALCVILSRPRIRDVFWRDGEINANAASEK